MGAYICVSFPAYLAAPTACQNGADLSSSGLMSSSHRELITKQLSKRLRLYSSTHFRTSYIATFIL
jgi:hypothetical protein